MNERGAPVAVAMSPHAGGRMIGWNHMYSNCCQSFDLAMIFNERGGRWLGPVAGAGPRCKPMERPPPAGEQARRAGTGRGSPHCVCACQTLHRQPARLVCGRVAYPLGRLPVPVLSPQRAVAAARQQWGSSMAARCAPASFTYAIRPTLIYP